MNPFKLMVAVFLLISCKQSEGNLIPNSENTAKETPVEENKKRQLSEAFKTYWYAREAEITSYKLSQERYGELREGTVVNIYVTEDFLPDVQVKANEKLDDNISVLKLNQTKKYITGIYPYSVMTSTFSPIGHKGHAKKISHSVQEWCGQVYAQLNNRSKFEIMLHSYFQGEADQEFDLEKTRLENDVWNLIRINPEELPTGEFSMIPSLEYFRMSHKPIAAFEAMGEITVGDSISRYTLTYPEIKRKLKIYYSSDFPYTIERWEKTHSNGLVTSAEKMKRLITPYWKQNSTHFEHLRDSLGL